MIFELPLEKVVSMRRSVRTYAEKPLPEEAIREVEGYIRTLSNPFGGSVRFGLLKSDHMHGGAKLGTYGTIKGAVYYLGAAVTQSELSLEALGYEFEQLILFAASKGLGTCWLGGTFQKSKFAKAMHVGSGEIFPAVSPVGYPADKLRTKESLMRRAVGADRRKPWSELFFDGAFGRPLSAAAGEYALPLELLRLAPSASNRQPWRVVRAKDMFHFYEHKQPGYSSALPYDIQRIDMGIAACHFHLAAMEHQLDGEFVRLEHPVSECPANTQYVMSWKAKLPEGTKKDG